MKAFVVALLVVVVVVSGGVIDIDALPGQTYWDCANQKSGDKELYNRHFEDTGSSLKVKTVTFNYPEEGDSKKIISCIKAIDHLEEQGQNGGTFQVLEGGVGYNYTVMKITSHKGDGYNYDVEIWGQ